MRLPTVYSTHQKALQIVIKNLWVSEFTVTRKCVIGKKEMRVGGFADGAEDEDMKYRLENRATRQLVWQRQRL